MSNKSVETQLKEAIEASKQTLALSEQVTSLAAEKEALSKRLADIETTLSAPKAEAPVATDPLIIAKLGELLAEREASSKMLKALAEKTDAALAYAAKLEKEAATKADLNQYVKQKREEGEEGETPAEKINESGKKKGVKDGEDDFVYEPVKQKFGAKGKKASKADDEEAPEMDQSEDEACDWEKPKSKGKAKAAKVKADDCDDGECDYGDLDDEEINLIKQYRNSSKTTAKPSADATPAKPFDEETKNFDKQFPQPGLNKNSKKTTPKAETDVEEIMESPDQQKKEDAEGGEEKEDHEKTLSKPEKGAKAKAEDVSLEPQAATAAKADALPQAVMDYIKQLVEKEKSASKTKADGEGGNQLGGINKKDVTLPKDEEDTKNEGSFLKKKDAKAESIGSAISDAKECSEENKVHEDGVAPTTGNTTKVGDTQPLAAEVATTPVAKTFDNVVEAAVERFATVAKAKKEAEEQLSKMGESLALEKNAKTEAYAAVAQLQAKFEALMGKVAQIEASDKSIEMKAAKIVSASASEAVAVGMDSAGIKTDEDVMKQFESIADAREKNKFFLANRQVIERVAMSNLKRRSR
jgi:hypothetical protein